MKVVRSAFLLASLCLGAGSAFADLLPATFDGVNGTIAFGYYVGPYSGTVGGKDFTFYCVDFLNGVHVGESWEANVTPLDGTGDLSNTRYGGAFGLANALTLYREAAWLTTQYEANPDEYGDIQATIWQLFAPVAPTPSSGKWLALAEANYLTLDFSKFDVVTNANVQQRGQIQEFIIDPEPVPEPTSVILFGTVLLLGCALARRKLVPAKVSTRNAD